MFDNYKQQLKDYIDKRVRYALYKNRVLSVEGTRLDIHYEGTAPELATYSPPYIKNKQDLTTKLEDLLEKNGLLQEIQLSYIRSSPMYSSRHLDQKGEVAELQDDMLNIAGQVVALQKLLGVTKKYQKEATLLVKGKKEVPIQRQL